jgi:hypothetical protein
MKKIYLVLFLLYGIQKIECQSYCMTNALIAAFPHDTAVIGQDSFVFIETSNTVALGLLRITQSASDSLALAMYTDGVFVQPTNSLGILSAIQGIAGVLPNTQVLHEIKPINPGQANVRYFQQNCPAYFRLITVVKPQLKLKIRAYLQGALLNSAALSIASNRPLMRTDLLNNPVTNKRYIPTLDPYKIMMMNNSRFIHHGPGAWSIYDSIPNPALVFALSGDNAIVDWVLVELRDEYDQTNVVATRAGLLQRDGDVVDLDGQSPLAFKDVPALPYFVAIKHRNHLSTMSKYALSVSALNKPIDFTNPLFETYDKGLVNGVNYTGLAQNTSTKPGFACLWAGDLNSDGKVKYENPDDEINFLIQEVINHPDNVNLSSTFNAAYGYFNSDIDMNGKIKYSNPNDDTNYIYSQIFFYPLNIGGNSNYSLFVEQIP